eukprot:scaffold14.g1023.t1
MSDWQDSSKRARTLQTPGPPSARRAAAPVGLPGGQEGRAVRRGATSPGAQPSDEEPELEEPEGGTYLAVHCWGARVGLAYYDPATGELLATEAADEAGGPFPHQLLQLAKLHAQPRLIFVSAKAEEGVVAALRAPLAAAGGTVGAHDGADGERSPAGKYEVRLEKSSLFAPAAARAALAAAHVRGMPRGLSERERLHALNARLSLARQLQVCAAGALLSILSRDGLLRATPAQCPSPPEPPSSSRSEASARSLFDGLADGSNNAPSSLPPDSEAAAAGGAFSLTSLAEFSLGGFLTLDPVSLEALQIFSSEGHPSAMGIGSSKEGFSVFSTLCRCVTPPGRRLLRLWFARPIIHLGVLNDRLDGVEFFVRRPDALAALRTALRKAGPGGKGGQCWDVEHGVKDAPRLLERLRGTQTAPDMHDFQALAAGLAAALQVRELVVQLAPAAATDGGASAGVAGSAWGAGSLSFQQQQRRQEERWDALGEAGPSPEASPQLGAAGGQLGSASLPAVLFKAAAALREELVACHSLITSVLDPEQALDGMMVAEGELDSLKALYFWLPDLLTRVVGFLMRVEGGALPAHLDEHLPDWTVAFEATGANDGGGGALGADAAEPAGGSYYHTACTRQLTARYGDIQHRIRDMELGIATQLTARLAGAQRAAFAPALAAAWLSLAELDCLLSLADAARELGLCRPQLMRAAELEIKGGRHLLAERLLPAGEFIPNDTSMGEASGRLQVVTGPNCSGKSVYAKQARPLAGLRASAGWPCRAASSCPCAKSVGVITFLAHVGSFVPAQSARVGLADRIFTRLSSHEAAAPGAGLPQQSSFMVDLTQVASMLRLATERSLCILDEFGKGTLATDGVGLLCGTLHHLAGLSRPPRLVLCTHFTEVLSPARLPRSPHLAFFTMSVIVQQAGAGPGPQRRAMASTAAPQEGGAGRPGAAERQAAQVQAASGGRQQQDGGDGGGDPATCAAGEWLSKAVGGWGCRERVSGAVLRASAEVTQLAAQQVIDCQLSGAAVQAAPLPELAARSAQCMGLARELAGISLRDGPAVAALLERATRLAAGEEVEEQQGRTSSEA